MCVPRVTILFIIISEAERDKIFSSALTLVRETSKLIYRIPLLEHNVIICIVCVCIGRFPFMSIYMFILYIYTYNIVMYMYKSSAWIVVVVTGPLSGQPLHGAPSVRNDDVLFDSIVLSCRLVGSVRRVQ